MIYEQEQAIYKIGIYNRTILSLIMYKICTDEVGINDLVNRQFLVFYYTSDISARSVSYTVFLHIKYQIFLLDQSITRLLFELNVGFIRRSNRIFPPDHKVTQFFQAMNMDNIVCLFGTKYKCKQISHDYVPSGTQFKYSNSPGD